MPLVQIRGIKLRISLLAVVFVCILGCKKDGKEIITPPSSSHPTIVWTADTIRNPFPGAQLTLYSIWGSDTNDVYAVGHDGYGGSSSLYHYDGSKWKVVVIVAADGGFIRSHIEPYKVSGSGKNDVWVVGSRGSYFYSQVDSSLAIHYDGATWSEVNMPRCKYSLLGIKVLSPNNVYLTGSRGEVYHYDGTSFTKTVLDPVLQIPSIDGNEDYLVVGGVGGQDTSSWTYCSVYVRNVLGEWRLVSKATDAEYYANQPFGVIGFYSPSAGSILAGGFKIFSLTGTNWSLLYKDNCNYVQIDGTGPDNIFASSVNNQLVHWNGTDWKQLNLPEGVIPNSDNTRLYAVWVKDNKIFLTYWYKFDTNIIFRGTYTK